MTIDVTCPKCNLILPAPESMAGRKIRCADCSTIVDVPAPGASTVDLQPAPRFDRASTGRTEDDERPVRRNRQRQPERLALATPLTAVVAVIALAIVGGALFLVLSTSEQKPQPPVVVAAPPPGQPMNVAIPAPVPPQAIVKPAVPETKPTPTPTRSPAEPISPAMLTGLRFHLTLDGKSGGGCFDSVSARSVGKLWPGVDFVEGKRGKALKIPLASRYSTVPTSGYGLDLSDVHERFSLAANTGATFALWAKIDDIARNSTRILNLGQDKISDRPRIYFSSTRTNGSVFASFDTSDYASAYFSQLGVSSWHHFALRRTAAGTWTSFLDGKAYSMSRNKGTDCPKLTFSNVGVGSSLAGTTGKASASLVIDDLCVFGRDLSDSEIARLAGSGKD